MNEIQILLAICKVGLTALAVRPCSIPSSVGATFSFDLGIIIAVLLTYDYAHYVILQEGCETSF